MGSSGAQMHDGAGMKIQRVHERQREKGREKARESALHAVNVNWEL